MNGTVSGSPELDRFLSGPVLEVAPALLGGFLQVGDVTVRITEVEAYDGSNDPGSHAYRGPTPRNATMFGPPGHLYVYFIYGMHHCCNVVTGTTGDPAAVLLRAGEVVSGTAQARGRRGRRPATERLASGPANLCRTLGVERDADGIDLAGPVATLTPAAGVKREVRSGPRVGLRHAASRPWRFWLPDEPTVSSYRPAASGR